MHPLLLLTLLFVLKSRAENSSYLWRPPALPRLFPPFPTYFDTFRMELMLDKMRTLTDALDKVNHLRQIDQTASKQDSKMERIGESLEVAKAFLADSKSQRNLQRLTQATETLRRIGEPSEWIAAAGSLLSHLEGLKGFEGK